MVSVASVERTKVPVCALMVKVYVPGWLGSPAWLSLRNDEDEELEEFEAPPPQPVAIRASARTPSSAIVAQNLRERFRSLKTNMPNPRPGNHIAKVACPPNRLAEVVVPLLTETVSLA